ncbi:hypothetical protein EVA_03020 [gut metagenome]|uniref:Uncharacterized protein n=1 Tax=gut metagenome TaxID=749906 RepID=J9GMS0_9ZZZZ
MLKNGLFHFSQSFSLVFSPFVHCTDEATDKKQRVFFATEKECVLLCYFCKLVFESLVL